MIRAVDVSSRAGFGDKMTLGTARLARVLGPEAESIAVSPFRSDHAA